jgi:hypothetical protein
VRVGRELLPLVLAAAVVVGGCSGNIGAPYTQPVAGRADVSVTEYRARVSGGLSDAVRIDLPDGTGAALIEVTAASGQFRLAQFVTPSGDDLVESGGFVTRDAREAPGLVDWLYPNSPSLVLEPGGHTLRFTALDGAGGPLDEDATVRVYMRARPVETTGSVHLDVRVPAGTIDGAEELVDDLVARVGEIYAQVGIAIADYTFGEVAMPSDSLTLGPAALTTVQKAFEGARAGAVHLLVTRALDDGEGAVSGYSLALPGPLDPTRLNAGVLVAAGAFTDGGPIDRAAMAVTWAHEIGHHLGLYHTSERDGRQHDPISDTPECDGSGPCDDESNVMFWTGGASRSLLTPGQASVMRLHPLCEDGAPN